MHDGLPFSILVVDDDEDDRMVIDEAFVAIGYGGKVKKFIDGKALLHYLEEVEPDLYPSLIVLDNTLPQLTAGDLLIILKSTPAYQSIPVVVYTTLLTPSKKEQLLAAGASACLEKGTSMEEVKQVATQLKNMAEEGPTKAGAH